MERRIKSFPIRFLITKPTRFSPGGSQMFYAHEWEALQKSEELARQGALAAEGAPAQPADAQFPNSPPNAQPKVEPAEPKVQAANSVTVNVPISSENSTRIFAPSEARGASSASFASLASSTSSASPLPPDFSRHSRKCSVCSHTDRDAIEGDFIRWRSPELIAKDYKIPDRSSIYRHAHSTGLFAWRKRELGRVLEGILESSELLPLEASDIIIRAARIYSHLDEQGNWSEPARVNFILTGPAFAPAGADRDAFNSSPSATRKKKRAKKSKMTQSSGSDRGKA